MSKYPRRGRGQESATVKSASLLFTSLKLASLVKIGHADGDREVEVVSNTNSPYIPRPAWIRARREHMFLKKHCFNSHYTEAAFALAIGLFDRLPKGTRPWLVKLFARIYPQVKTSKRNSSHHDVVSARTKKTTTRPEVQESYENMTRHKSSC